MKWIETRGRTPKTGERLLKVLFRNGWESKHEYKAAQLRWSDSGGEWDVVGVRRA